ncbi:BCCT family transporter [Tuberibacillus sp. Marseille-P3662]|uniref:BCCT family transporter n=1 Tax=Tuberibacillus sp. Marseille-P3662 TaxID=1965358 RepID=UPI000A1CAAFB|nr:BCCT family transporter [Tuberibacillus sp. Marseille-P3662]
MNGKRVRWGVFLPMAILLIGTVLVGIIAPTSFYNLQTVIVNFAFNNFGWLFSLVVFVLIFICLFLGFSKFGNIRVGGDDAEPFIKKWEWFAISLTGGIGTGLLFWGTAEPLTHFMNPPQALGIDAGSEEAATFSMAAVMMQWTLAPYALYVICGISVAYTHYNLKLPYSVSSTLYPILGKRALGLTGTIVDNVCMFAIAGAMAAILGEGVLQISSGIGHYTSINDGPVLWAILILAITATYIISSYTGLQKGIKFLADNNAKIFIFLLIFVLIMGPTAFIFNIGTQGAGSYLSNMAKLHLWLSPMEGSSWSKDWPIFEWALWGANAPLIGMFLARLSYGRTLRQFVTFNLLLPGGFGALWFWAFGGSAMFFDWKSGGQLWNIISTEDGGLQLSLFAFLEKFPLSTIIGWVILVAIYLSFTTLADSLTTTMSSLTTTGNTIKNPEPPPRIKIFWGSVMGLMALLTVTSGTGGEISGIDAVKQMATLAGFPVLFLIIMQIFSTVKSILNHDKVDPPSKTTVNTYVKGQNTEVESSTTNL